ncbi:host-nuclease inhibitor Gam family protein [Actinobacillus equuli]|uniref:host-nuclease inhibitor Gam family protein n=1 Tax=Actinobacillus equuli TaxID=718 RepID=UPI0031015CCF
MLSHCKSYVKRWKVVKKQFKHGVKVIVMSLTKNGKQKTGYFNTGEVQWRQNPPSVRVTKAEQVIENLKLLGLTQFIRTKEEINKDAILLEPETAQTVAGITIRTGTEEFVVKPFEQETR